MSKLLSVNEVREMWPDPKPTEKALKRLAKATGCCRKLGRAVGFTDSDVQQLLSLCSGSPETRKARTGTSAAPSPDAAYAKARALLIEAKRKRLEGNETPNSTTSLRLVSSGRQHGAKP